MRRQLDNAKGGHGLTVKRLEGALARAEERLKKLTDGAKDPGITFEETGIDYLMVDEAHGYKNLRTVSNIHGVGIEGSQRASDLDMKLDYLRERHGGRVATFATATPIANSVSEAFTMQRFLRPDLLDAAGLTDFDTWAATFGEVTTDLELAPDGSRFRMQSRFAKFRNVPELLRMWHVSADIKTAEDLQLPTPALRDGHAETVVVPATEELTAFMGELSARADKVQSRAVPPEEDNMLKVATHGRMAALDLRLLGRDPGQDAKLAAAATRIAGIHHANADRAYPDSDVRRVAAARVLRPGHPVSSIAQRRLPVRRLERLRRAEAAARRAGRARREDPLRPRGPQRQGEGRDVRRRPQRADLRPARLDRRRWASAPTSKPARSRCTTSTARGGQPTSPSARAASCARAISTPRSR